MVMNSTFNFIKNLANPAAPELRSARLTSPSTRLYDYLSEIFLAPYETKKSFEILEKLAGPFHGKECWQKFLVRDFLFPSFHMMIYKNGIGSKIQIESLGKTWHRIK